MANWYVLINFYSVQPVSSSRAIQAVPAEVTSAMLSIRIHEKQKKKKYINRRATSPGETKKIVVGYNLCLRGVCCAKEFELHPSANLERQKNSRIKQKNIEYKNKEEKKIQQKRRDRDSEREKLVPLPMPPPLHAIELLVNKIRDACVNCVSEFGMEWRAIHTYISLYDVFFCFVLLSVLFFVPLLGGRR